MVIEVTRKTLPLRKVIFKKAGLFFRRGIHILVADVFDKPELRGEVGGWYTKGGTPIRHPSAYCAKGWSNAVYVRSSLTLACSFKWLEENVNEELAKYYVIPKILGKL